MHNPTNKARRSVRFSDVTVYYFQRVQGFVCVPSDAGATLGMRLNHSYSETFNLSKHDYLRDWEDEREENKMYNKLLFERARGIEPPDYQWTMNMLKNKKKLIGKGPLYPLSFRQRLYKLKSAGVEIIDATEKDDINRIRDSRMICGCSCTDGCRTACPCAEAGVPCQVERNAANSYPCNCGLSGCENESGRAEYDLDSIKTFVRRTLERTRGGFETTESLESVQNQLKNTHKDSNVILSIILDDVDVEESCLGKAYPLPEVYCSDSILQRTMTSNFLPGFETFDCGCYRTDSSQELCPNCTCEPMDVASSPETCEDECFEKELREEYCYGCFQKPCITITKMMTNFQQLAIISDTHDQGTMTILWPWYEDVEQVITGQKGPSAMLVDPSNSRKRILEESDVIEMVNHSNAFQKIFQSFVVNSRRKVNAVFRGRNIHKVKENTDLLKVNSNDIMPALVPLPETLNSNIPCNKSKNEYTTSILSKIRDFTAIKPFAFSFDKTSSESLPGSLSSSSGDLQLLTSQCNMSNFEKACSTPNLVHDMSKVKQDKTEVTDDSNVTTANECNKLQKMVLINRSSSLERSFHSLSRIKSRNLVRSDVKCRSSENFLKSVKMNNTLKRVNKSEQGRRSRKSYLKQDETPCSNNTKMSLPDSDSSRPNTPDQIPVVINESDSSISNSSEQLPISAEKFISELQSLTYSFKPKISLNAPISLLPQQKQVTSGKHLKSYTVIPTSHSSISGVHPLLGQDSPSIFISSTQSDASPSNVSSDSAPGSFFHLVSADSKSSIVFNQSKGIWSTSGESQRSQNISHLVSFFIKDIHSRISSSKCNHKNNTLDEVGHLLTDTPSKLLDIAMSSTVFDLPFRSI